MARTDRPQPTRSVPLLRIFLCSPGDVAEERAAARQECQEFRAGAITMRGKETSYGATQTAGYS